MGLRHADTWGRRRRSLDLCALLCLLVVSVASAAEDVYQETRGPFTIHYGPRTRVDLDRIIDFLTAGREQLCGALGLEDPRPVDVTLCETAGEFDEALGFDAPWFYAGVAFADEREMVINLPVAALELKQVLTHELCHIYLSDALGDRLAVVPRWMNEAIAKSLSDEWNESEDILLRDAVLAGHLLDFEQIERSFPAEHRASTIAYAQSATFLEFAESRYGPGVLGRYLAGVRGGRSHGAALTDACGVPLTVVQEEWLTYLRKHYRKVLLLYRIDELIFFVMAVLVVAAVIATVRRRRRWEASQSHADRELPPSMVSPEHPRPCQDRQGKRRIHS